MLKMKNVNGMNRHLSAFPRFSLVELLITIAIIAILSSILLPALNKAKGVGKRISCVGNLKQFGVATQMYISDNRDYAMGSYCYTRPAMSGNLWPYLVPNHEMADYKNKPELVPASFIMNCPADPAPWIWSSVAASHYPYGLNVRLCYGYYTSGACYLGVKVVGNIARNAARIGVFVDNIGATEGIWGPSSTVGNSNCPSARHLGGVNMSFLDGHVESRKGEGIVDADVFWDYLFSQYWGGNQGKPCGNEGFLNTLHLP